uniref:Uncharacterized protein n=1 Tax=Knipowitschia caucasica TaxID=637954 RepID=A0AAV2MB13_KNICA
MRIGVSTEITDKGNNEAISDKCTVKVRHRLTEEVLLLEEVGVTGVWPLCCTCAPEPQPVHGVSSSARPGRLLALSQVRSPPHLLSSAPAMCTLPPQALTDIQYKSCPIPHLVLHSGPARAPQ